MPTGLCLEQNWCMCVHTGAGIYPDLKQQNHPSLPVFPQIELMVNARHRHQSSCVEE